MAIWPCIWHRAINANPKRPRPPRCVVIEHHAPDAGWAARVLLFFCLLVGWLADSRSRGSVALLRMEPMLPEGSRPSGQADAFHFVRRVPTLPHTSDAHDVIEPPWNMCSWMEQEERVEKLAVFLLENSAKTGHGVPCCNARQMRVVHHKLAVDINLSVGVTACPSQQICWKWKKVNVTSAQSLVKRKNSETSALDFGWSGVTKEQTCGAIRRNAACDEIRCDAMRCHDSHMQARDTSRPLPASSSLVSSRSRNSRNASFARGLFDNELEDVLNVFRHGPGCTQGLVTVAFVVSSQVKVLSWHI